MADGLALDEVFPIKGRNVRVTEKAFANLEAARNCLIDVARHRATITYGEFIADSELPYLAQGIGRFLDIITEDCRRRGEPSLASVVVNKASGDVGSDYEGDAARERRLLYAWWT